ncbi:MAG: hypothetical protein GXP32_10025 [Kiritimatiellaeota bacterium]|nr:hypothetical protein [Kiritimatiellota bacterium]
MRIASILLIISAWFIVSCATTPEAPGPKPAVETAENGKQAPQDASAPADDGKKRKNPFFEDDDVDSHYDNDDEDEWFVSEWFFAIVKGFWHIVTYPGRALR